MKRTESEEEHNDVKDAVKGYIIPSWLTCSLSSMLTSAIQTQAHFRGLLTCQEQNQFKTLKVLNHASRTLPRLPYTNLKESRTEKKLVTEHA